MEGEGKGIQKELRGARHQESDRCVLQTWTDKNVEIRKVF